ncbi:hypothetical protein CYMTET_51347, partial [Cymbomonas tetramitiformis]
RSALPEDNDGLVAYFEKFNLVEWMGSLDRWVALLQAAWVFFAMAHLLVVMRGQGTLTVIVDATWSSLITQLNLIPFYVCLLSYAVVFNLCMGPKHEAFTTLNKSLMKMSLFAYVGDFDQNDWNMHEAWESKALEYTGEKIFSLTFLCLYYFMLSQLQFALVLDAAYLGWAEAPPDISEKTIHKELLKIAQRCALRRFGRWPSADHLIWLLRVLHLQDQKTEDRCFQYSSKQSMLQILKRFSVLLKEQESAPRHIDVGGRDLALEELAAILQHRAESCAMRRQKTLMQRATRGVKAQPRGSMSFRRYLVPRERMHAEEPVDNDLELLSQYFVIPSLQSTVMPMASEGPMPQMDMPAVSQRPKGAPERELAARIITRFGTDQPDEGQSDDAPSASSQRREQLRQRLDLVTSNNAAPFSTMMLVTSSSQSCSVALLRPPRRALIRIAHNHASVLQPLGKAWLPSWHQFPISEQNLLRTSFRRGEYRLEAFSLEQHHCSTAIMLPGRCGNYLALPK